MSVRFVSEELVLIIHNDLLRRYGGMEGIRSKELLLSALAQPQMTMGGKYLHKTIFDKASAYGFHLCRNHPFLDGNKRIAFVIMDIFLQANGWEISSSEEDAYTMMIDLASGNCSKKELSTWLKAHTTKLK